MGSAAQATPDQLQACSNPALCNRQGGSSLSKEKVTWALSLAGAARCRAVLNILCLVWQATSTGCRATENMRRGTPEWACMNLCMWASRGETFSHALLLQGHCGRQISNNACACSINGPALVNVSPHVRQFQPNESVAVRTLTANAHVLLTNHVRLPLKMKQQPSSQKDM